MKLVTEALFGPLFELIVDAVVVVDDNLRFVGANAGACRMLGYTRMEIAQLTVAELTPPEDVAELPRLWSQFRAAGALSGRYRLRGRDGRVRVTEFHAVANAAPGVHIATLRDVTEAVEATEALRRQNEVLQTILDHIPVMLNLVGADGRVQWVNNAWERVLGWSLKEAQDLDARRTGESGSADRRRASSATDRGDAGWSDFETRRKDGVLIDTTWADVALSDGTTIGIGQDITERKRAERELLESREQLRRLSGHFADTVERERTTIAQELHDELGQALTALKMDVNFLAERIGPVGAPDVRRRIEHMSNLLDDAIADVRRISAGIRPAALDRLGLIEAIAGLTRGVEQRCGLRCRLKTSLSAVDLERGVATHVYRIVQEALTNGLRHARATHIVVSIAAVGNQLEVAVRDNGTGITDAALVNRDALGLLGMKERALLAGGVLDITRLARKGTEVRLVIPRAISQGPPKN